MRARVPSIEYESEVVQTVTNKNITTPPCFLYGKVSKNIKPLQYYNRILSLKID
jgi:hypothetical protein